MGKITCTMIKPDAVQKNTIGAILKMINEGGFTIIAMKMTRLSHTEAAKFYEEHKERPFFRSLVDYMSSGPIIAAVLERTDGVGDAVSSFRQLIGTTNPANAEEGTIRRAFGESIERNAIHGSDSSENALRESLFHFSYRDFYDKKHRNYSVVIEN